MFDPDRQQLLADLRRKMAPGEVSAGSVSAGSGGAGSGGAGFEGRMLAVPAPLAEILPRGGLPRGGVVGLAGDGGTISLLFTLLAAPANAWSALVGMPEVGLLAAAELGVDLDRIVLVPDPGPDVLQVLSVLADGVDIVAVTGPLPGATPARLRVLTARLRQSGAVLVVNGRWPGADLVLQSRIEGWTGMGRGHGRLRDRVLVVEVAGRGAAGRRRSAAMLLRSSRTGIDVARFDVAGLDVAGFDVPASAGALDRAGRALEPMVADVG